MKTTVDYVSYMMELDWWERRAVVLTDAPSNCPHCPIVEACADAMVMGEGEGCRELRFAWADAKVRREK